MTLFTYSIPRLGASSFAILANTELVVVVSLGVLVLGEALTPVARDRRRADRRRRRRRTSLARRPAPAPQPAEGDLASLAGSAPSPPAEARSVFLDRQVEMRERAVDVRPDDLRRRPDIGFVELAVAVDPEQ